ASGYWHIADSQTGYTAINRWALENLDLDKVYPRYGMPNDFLVRLNVIRARVRDVIIRPVYNVGERSRLKVWKVLFTISFMLARMFLWRLKEKYIIRDFHPLIFFYFFGAFFASLGFILGCVEIAHKLKFGQVPAASVVLVALLMISGFQFLCFAM